MQSDIIIIGGGLIGLVTAWRLAGEGAGVTVIEAGDAGGGTTRAAAGMLCPGFELEHIEPHKQASFHRFAMASLTDWREMTPGLEEIAGDVIDLRLTGALGLARNDDEAEALRVLASKLAGFDRRPVMMTPREIASLQPGLSGDFVAGLYLADEGQVDPRLAVSALTSAVKARGGRIIDHQAVKSLRRRDGRIVEALLGDGRIVQGDTFILAAGLAARDFWAESGEPPLFAIKGQALSLQVKDQDLTCVLRARGTYVCPKKGGRIVVGASEEEAVETLTTDEDEITRLRQGAATVVPALAKAQMIEDWAGLRPTTPDRLPIIGRSGNVENLIYACGHHRNGILLAPATARLVSAIIGGAGTPLLTAPDRFWNKSLGG